MKIPDDLQALIEHGDLMAEDTNQIHLKVNWYRIRSHYLANRPMTVQEAGRLSRRNPSEAQRKSSKINGAKNKGKKGGAK